MLYFEGVRGLRECGLCYDMNAAKYHCQYMLGAVPCCCFSLCHCMCVLSLSLYQIVWRICVVSWQ